MIIAFAAGAGSGKSFAADYLSKKYGFKLMAFADPFYVLVECLMDLTKEQIQDVKDVPIDWLGGITCRQLLRSVGTEWGRDIIHENIWVESLIRRAKNHPNVVIQDVRFENEAQAVRDAGGMVIHILAPTVKSKAHEHISEQVLDKKKNDKLILNTFNSSFLEGLDAIISEANIATGSGS